MAHEMPTPRVAGARLRLFVWLLRTWLGPLLRRVSARMLMGPLRRADLGDVAPSATPPLPPERHEG